MSVGRWVKTIPQSSQRHVTVSAPWSAVGPVDGPGDPAASSRADAGAYPRSLSDDESSILSDDCEKTGDGERNAGAALYIVDHVDKLFGAV